MVSIGSRACGIDEAFHPTVTGSHEHVEKTGNIAFISEDRILDGERHRGESSLLKHVIDPVTDPSAHPEVPNVSFREGELSPLFSLNSVSDLFEIYPLACSEVIQSYYALV